MSNLAKWHVHGPVKTLRTELSEWDMPKAHWDSARGLTVCSFRLDGRMDESAFHNPDGSILHTQCFYNERGQLFQTDRWIGDGPRVQTRYFHEGDRHVRTVTVSQNGATRDSETCQYDDRGRKTKVCFLGPETPNMAYEVEETGNGYSAPGATTMTIIYDLADQPIDVLFHDADRQLLRRVFLVRDRAGRLVREELHISDEDLFPDRAGAIVAALLGPSDVFSSSTYEYDDAGRITVHNRQMCGLSEETTTFRYDENGNVIAEITDRHSRQVGLNDKEDLQIASEQAGNQETRLDYTYDEHGNWIERIVWIWNGSDFQRSNTTRRAITYY
jgi:YD repeat-containing protein